MQIFLTIHSKLKEIENNKKFDNCVEQLLSYYQLFIKNKLYKHVYIKNQSALIYFSSLPIKNANQYLSTTDEHAYFSIGTPTGLPDLFNRYNKRYDGKVRLKNLYDLFSEHGTNLISKISAPFIFGFLNHGDILLAHDGIGFEQGYIFENEKYWMCSNKCRPILLFSSDKFEIDSEAWNHYFGCGWFNDDRTPFKELKSLGEGEMWTCSNGRITCKKIDCWENWLSPLNLKSKDLLEYFRISFNDAVKELADTYTPGQVWADLSGGRDTRAILSALIHQNIDTHFTTVGKNLSPDVRAVKIIKEKCLTRVDFKNPSLMEKNELNEKLSKFILWQDGFGEFKSCRHMTLKPQEINPVPRFSGLAGGFYKGYGYPKKSLSKSIAGQSKKLIKLCLGYKNKKNTIKAPYIAHGDKIIDQGKHYGLTGDSLYDYYGFIERGRRWSSACASTNFNTIMLPFLNLNLIRCCFSVPANLKRNHVLHDYVIENNAKELSKIPYADDLIASGKYSFKLPYDENSFWRKRESVELLKYIINRDFVLWSIIEKSLVIELLEDHINQRTNHGGFLWFVAGFNFWYEEHKTYFKG